MTTAFPILDWHINTSYREVEARRHLGRLPLLINPACADPVWQQVQDNYRDGWQPEPPNSGWKLVADDYLIYPGLPPVAPAAMAWLRSERILVYPAGWVVVTTLDGKFTVARIIP